jgi:O-antigen/teichoic acid export membrane protein
MNSPTRLDSVNRRPLRILSSLKDARGALKPGAWGIADQGLSALASLVVNLALIRWLGPDDYGAFAVAFAAFYLLAGLHNALLSEPLLVFGAGVYRHDATDYLQTLTLGHWLVSGLLSAALTLFALSAWWQGSPALFQAFLGAGLATPGLLLLTLGRRVHYLRGTPRPAAIGGGLYLLAALAGVFALSWLGLLSAFSAYLLMGSFSALVGALLLRGLGIRLLGRSARWPAREVAQNHWHYGRWVIASTVAAWIPGNLYFMVLPAMHGLDDVGILAALMLFLRPVMTIVQPLALLLVPRLVAQAGTPNATQDVIATTAVFAAVSLVYWIGLGFAHGPLAALILGAEYRPHSHILILLGGVAPALAIAAVFASGLRAGMRPDLEFKAHLFSAAIAVGVGLPLVLAQGLTGAAIGLPVSMAALAVAMAFLFFTRVANTP